MDELMVELNLIFSSLTRSGLASHRRAFVQVNCLGKYGRANKTAFRVYLERKKAG